MRVGTGYDSHRLVEGRRLIIGGVEIPFERGLLGHSDADVLAHAVIDSILGAMGLGDIGRHFPDTSEEFRDADSMRLLSHVLSLVHENAYEVAWVDSTVICERPRLAQHIEGMKERFAAAGLGHINIKAKSNEGMGFTGRGEGIVAQAICLLIKNPPD